MGFFKDTTMKAMQLDLAVSYTPPGSDMSMTLATIRDAALLVAALKIAITNANSRLKAANTPLAAKGLRAQRDYLTLCLTEVMGQPEDYPAGVM
jgi:hypothetical protein